MRSLAARRLTCAGALLAALVWAWRKPLRLRHVPIWLDDYDRHEVAS